MGKLKKFAELETFDNVYQKPPSDVVKGKWHTIFGNDNPIVLELACGKGDYTLALAKRFPNQNFIGVDIKGNRIHVGARKAISQSLTNVRFLRCFIDNIDQYFATNEVSEIWITFPDPYLRKSKSNKRLTSPNFLNRYKKVVKPNANIHLKTDSLELFEFTKETLKEEGYSIDKIIEDVYQEDHDMPLLTEVQTHYETMHLADNRTIRYIRFRMN